MLRVPSLDELVAAAEGSLLAVHRGEPPEYRFDAAATVLVDGLTGQVLTLLHSSRPTPLCAADIAVGVRHLAPAGAEVVGILAGGELAIAQAQAIARVLPTLREVRIWSEQPIERLGTAQRLRGDFGIPAVAVTCAADAVADADVVVAVGTATDQTPMPGAWLRSGALLVCRPFTAPEDLVATSRRFVPSLRQPLILAVPVSSDVANVRPRYDRTRDLELAEVILGHYAARTSDDETVVYEPVTLACSAVG
jgi:ornithine cyclodeaminase/alanine dehydrogenase-like protein (mu-crystallin family)